MPATIPQTDAMIANHRPWPHSGSVSGSGIIKLQTKIDKAMKTPPPPDTKLGRRELCPIIERTCIIVAANKTIPESISIMVVTYPALCQSAIFPHSSSFSEDVAPSIDSMQSSYRSPRFSELDSHVTPLHTSAEISLSPISESVV